MCKQKKNWSLGGLRKGRQFWFHSKSWRYKFWWRVLLISLAFPSSPRANQPAPFLMYTHFPWKKKQSNNQTKDKQAIAKQIKTKHFLLTILSRAKHVKHNSSFQKKKYLKHIEKDDIILDISSMSYYEQVALEWRLCTSAVSVYWFYYSLSLEHWPPTEHQCKDVFHLFVQILFLFVFSQTISLFPKILCCLLFFGNWLKFRVDMVWRLMAFWIKFNGR